MQVHLYFLGHLAINRAVQHLQGPLAVVKTPMAGLQIQQSPLVETVKMPSLYNKQGKQIVIKHGRNTGQAYHQQYNMHAVLTIG